MSIISTPRRTARIFPRLLLLGPPVLLISLLLLASSSGVANAQTVALHCTYKTLISGVGSGWQTREFTYKVDLDRGKGFFGADDPRQEYRDGLNVVYIEEGHIFIGIGPMPTNRGGRPDGAAAPSQYNINRYTGRLHGIADRRTIYDGRCTVARKQF
jgi:hypothetical protein